ncbi:hypothetical protein F4861DRAFT_403503 [Xylaria intraflava]|nr:hypothetical protein F4861DRAFT_403503 [Xylaria intraflava]
MDDATTTIIVGAIVGVLALLAVVLRFYVRYYKRHGYSWDDWFILFSILSVIALDAVNLYATDLDPNGSEVASSNGKIEYSPADEAYTKVTYASTVLYFALTSATKLSILCLYYRIFSVNKSFRYQVIGMIIVVTCFCIGTVVADLLNCIPLKWTWLNSLDDPRYCFNYNYFWLASGIVEAVLDIVILSLPIPVVSRLRVKGGKKYAIVGVFLVGIFVVISGVVKVILSYQPNSRDPSFNQTQIWTTVHLCTGIICACMPVCWPLLVSLGKLRPRLWFTRVPQVSPKSWRSWGASWVSRERRSPENRYPFNATNEEYDLGASDTRILRDTYTSV